MTLKNNQFWNVRAQGKRKSLQQLKVILVARSQPSTAQFYDCFIQGTFEIDT